MADFVAAVAESLQVPIDLPASMALASLSVCCGGRWRVAPRVGWAEPVNLYVVCALPPSERKSGVLSALSGPFADWERSRAEALKPLVREAKAAQAVLTKRLAKLVEAAAKEDDPASRTALIQLVRDAEDELAEIAAPPMPRLLTDDATPERLVTLLAEQGGRIGALSPEGGVLEALAGRRYGDSPNLDAMLKSHSGDPIRVDRMGRESLHIEAPALTLGVCPQPDVLRGLLDDAANRGCGLVSRFLYLLPASRLGRRQANPPAVPASLARWWAETLGRLLDAAAGPVLSDACRRPPEPPIELPLTAEAARLLVELETAIEPRLGPEGDLSDTCGWGGKQLGQTLRLAALLHLPAEGDPTRPRPIEADTLARAWAIAEALTAHAKAAFRLMGASAELEAARRLWSWVQWNGRETFSRAEAFRDLRRSACFARPDALDGPTRLLAEHGYIQPLPTPGLGRGRPPAPRWEVNPKSRPEEDPPATKSTLSTKSDLPVSDAITLVDFVDTPSPKSPAQPSPSTVAASREDSMKPCSPTGNMESGVSKLPETPEPASPSPDAVKWEVKRI